MPSVRWISVGGSGTDHLRPWSEDRLTVANAAGVAAGMMAQHVLGAMLAFSLGVPGFAAAQRARPRQPREVEPNDGKTVLILGLGKTGQAAAAPSSALGLEVLGVRGTARRRRREDWRSNDPKRAAHLIVSYLAALFGQWTPTRPHVSLTSHASLSVGPGSIQSARGGCDGKARHRGSRERVCNARSEPQRPLDW